MKTVILVLLGGLFLYRLYTCKHSRECAKKVREYFKGKFSGEKEQ